MAIPPPRMVAAFWVTLDSPASRTLPVWSKIQIPPPVAALLPDTRGSCRSFKVPARISIPPPDPSAGLAMLSLTRDESFMTSLAVSPYTATPPRPEAISATSPSSARRVAASPSSSSSPNCVEEEGQPRCEPRGLRGHSDRSPDGLRARTHNRNRSTFPVCRWGRGGAAPLPLDPGAVGSPRCVVGVREGGAMI